MDPVDRDDVEARELKNLVHGSCTLAKYDQGYLLSSQALSLSVFASVSVSACCV